ncbi:MAG: endonuclease/exonuclease/phosphatase family protein [Bifidobacteriaceae bacterium]|jgi:exodeoxyribonuclease-3|nr:endonuclease/exonuclease/phosphatase family protein [Bifidobacteriaceae bacterium]
MRIATWNVNSIRARIDRVVAYLEAADVDVLAIQETKVAADAFPREPFEAAGYEVAASGVNQWNGVAVISRLGVDDAVPSFPGQPTFGDPPALEPRALGVTCGGVRVWSLYVPHGRGADDPHMAYKLAWLRALADQARGWLAEAPGAAIALLGDWNVAPLDTDVWDVAHFAGITHVSPAERAAFAAFGEAGFREVTREFIPARHQYTQWDYQAGRWHRDQGMRIDFACCSPALADAVTAVRIVRDERAGRGASDHVPVEIDVADAGTVGGRLSGANGGQLG